MSKIGPRIYASLAALLVCCPSFAIARESYDMSHCTNDITKAGTSTVTRCQKKSWPKKKVSQRLQLQHRHLPQSHTQNKSRITGNSWMS